MGDEPGPTPPASLGHFDPLSASRLVCRGSDAAEGAGRPLDEKEAEDQPCPSARENRLLRLRRAFAKESVARRELGVLMLGAALRRMRV